MFNKIVNNSHRTFACLRTKSIQNSVVKQVSGCLSILCHERHHFQLKVHHKAFVGRARARIRYRGSHRLRAPSDQTAGFIEGREGK